MLARQNAQRIGKLISFPAPRVWLLREAIENLRLQNVAPVMARFAELYGAVLHQIGMRKQALAGRRLRRWARHPRCRRDGSVLGTSSTASGATPVDS